MRGRGKARDTLHRMDTTLPAVPRPEQGWDPRRLKAEHVAPGHRAPGNCGIIAT